MSSPRQWFEIALFIVLGFVSIGMAILPMGLTADSIPFPDLLFCVFAAWVIRHPGTAPMLAIAGLGLIADAMMMRPIGLWALMLLLGTEGLRISERAFRDIPFLLEWVYVSGFLIIMIILQNVILLVSFDNVYDAGMLAGHVLRTIAIYPIVVATLHWVFRIRTPKPNERPNQLGYTL